MSKAWTWMISSPWPRIASRVFGDGTVASWIRATAALGWPPFYGVSLLAGALKINVATFLSLGLIGRVVRFGVLAWGARAVGSEATERLTSAWSSLVMPVLGG